MITVFEVEGQVPGYKISYCIEGYYFLSTYDFHSYFPDIGEDMDVSVVFQNFIIFSMAAVVVVAVDIAVVIFVPHVVALFVAHVVAIASLFPIWMAFFIQAGFVSIPVLAALSISFVVSVLAISQSNC